MRARTVVLRADLLGRHANTWSDLPILKTPLST